MGWGGVTLLFSKPNSRFKGAVRSKGLNPNLLHLEKKLIRQIEESLFARLIMERNYKTVEGLTANFESNCYSSPTHRSHENILGITLTCSCKQPRTCCKRWLFREARLVTL